jgi:tellurite resistance protein
MVEIRPPDLPTTSAPAPEASGGRLRLSANVFGLPFGLCGLAQAWATARDTAAAPGAVVDGLWLLAAAVWAVTVVGYAVNIAGDGRWRTEAADPTVGPFTALVPIPLMLFGVALAGHADTAGRAVFVVGLVLTVGLGGWLTAQWILTPVALDRWHPGYFLPTAAGGLLAATGSAALGYAQLAHVMLGVGLVSWMVLGSILLLRLCTRPRLPGPLLPTLAIEIAPPVVAGNAWFAIDGGVVDDAALLLAGYALLMAMVQLRLVALYRTVPFGIGFGAFAFSYAAVVTNALHWLAAEHATGRHALTYALLAVLTAGMAALVARTLVGLSRGTYLLRTAPAPASAPS